MTCQEDEVKTGARSCRVVLESLKDGARRVGQTASTKYLSVLSSVVYLERALLALALALGKLDFLRGELSEVTMFG